MEVEFSKSIELEMKSRSQSPGQRNIFPKIDFVWARVSHITVSCVKESGTRSTVHGPASGGEFISVYLAARQNTR
jgi:hypothetical protein